MRQKINARLTLIALVAVVAVSLGLTVIYYNLFQQRVREDLQVSADLLNETGIFQSLYENTDGSGQTAGTEIDESVQMTGTEAAGSEQTAGTETAGSGQIVGNESAGDRAQAIETALESLENDSLRITWIDSDGSVLYDNDTAASGMENHLDRPEIQQAIAQGAGESIRRSDTLNMNTFYYALLLDNGTILRVSTDARTIFSVFLAAAPIVLAIAAAVWLLCILLGRMLTESILRPIDSMAEHLDDPADASKTLLYKELEPFAEKIRAQHENVLAAAQSRQDFTANISHELKTPLTAISGYAELIENHMIGPEQEEHIAKQIRHNSERLLSLINDIIRLSELDHQERARSFERVELYDLASECCRELQVSASQKQVNLTFYGKHIALTGDRDLLKELIENLVQNAIRYNHEHGHVIVIVSGEEAHAVLTVKDDGIGIPKDQQDRIFERFYRVDKSRSRETGGTGLGLAIVKHIVEIHGASITVDSEPGRGSTFAVHF